MGFVIVNDQYGVVDYGIIYGDKETAENRLIDLQTDGDNNYEGELQLFEVSRVNGVGINAKYRVCEHCKGKMYFGDKYWVNYNGGQLFCSYDCAEIDCAENGHGNEVDELIGEDTIEGEMLKGVEN